MSEAEILIILFSFVLIKSNICLVRPFENDKSTHINININSDAVLMFVKLFDMSRILKNSSYATLLLSEIANIFNSSILFSSLLSLDETLYKIRFCIIDSKKEVKRNDAKNMNKKIRIVLMENNLRLSKESCNIDLLLSIIRSDMSVNNIAINV